MLPFLLYTISPNTLFCLSFSVFTSSYSRLPYLLARSAGMIMLKVAAGSPIPTVPWTLGMDRLAVIINTTLYNQAYFFSLILPYKYTMLATYG